MLAGLPVGVGGVDLGHARHFEAQLVEGCEGWDQVGKSAADRKLGDAAVGEGLGDGLDVVIPNDVAEINEVVACVNALAVGPECGAVDAVVLQAFCPLRNSSLKKLNFLHGGFLRSFCCECILPLKCGYIQSFQRHIVHDHSTEKLCIF